MWAVDTLLYKQNKKMLHCPSFCRAPLMCSLPLGMQAWQVNCIDATLKPCLRGRRPPPRPPTCETFTTVRGSYTPVHVKQLASWYLSTTGALWIGMALFTSIYKYLQSTAKKKKMNGWYHWLLSWNPANQKLLNMFVWRPCGQGKRLKG